MLDPRSFDELKSRLQATFSLSDCTGLVRPWHKPEHPTDVRIFVAIRGNADMTRTPHFGSDCPPKRPWNARLSNFCRNIPKRKKLFEFDCEWPVASY
jgi:hypothetical protein